MPEAKMRTVDALIEEVEQNVELYYDDQEVDPMDIPRLSVEDVLYGISLPETAITRYWNRLINVAVEKYKTLVEHEEF